MTRFASDSPKEPPPGIERPAWLQLPGSRATVLFHMADAQILLYLSMCARTNDLEQFTTEALRRCVSSIRFHQEEDLALFLDGQPLDGNPLDQLIHGSQKFRRLLIAHFFNCVRFIHQEEAELKNSWATPGTISMN